MVSDINKAQFSLLYPEGVPAAPAMKLSAAAADDLCLSEHFRMKSASLSEFFTCSPDVIEYRQQSVKDVMNVPEALAALKKCVPVMADIADLRRLSQDADSADSYLYGITEVELYQSLLEILSNDLLPQRERLESSAMRTLCDRVEELTNSEYCKKINSLLTELTYRVREIKSVTVGVNLDGRLFPESAGLLSVNAEPFRSGQTLDKILKLDFKQNENSFIAPMAKASKTFTDPEAEALRRSTLSALGSVFKSGFKSWKRIVRTYVLENTDFLMGVLPEIEFLSLAGTYLSSLAEKGVKLCFPKVYPDGKILRAKGLVNPRIALATDSEMVPNDVDFDENAGIYVITGPNRGGKSVFTCAVGLAVMTASLGLPVCADEFEMSACDNVFCHFPNGEDDTVEKGRLGEECARLSDIVAGVTGQSLVLLDESLSSTGSYEAAAIAEEVLAGLSAAGCRAIFSTHLHALAAAVPAINGRCAALGGVKIDNLVADISAGVRSFKVERRAPEGKSYASDIAEKYGLSLDSILKKVREHE